MNSPAGPQHAIIVPGNHDEYLKVFRGCTRSGMASCTRWLHCARSGGARNVQHHVFGHLHAAGGHMLKKGRTRRLQRGCLGRRIQLVNGPRVFDVQSSK